MLLKMKNIKRMVCFIISSLLVVNLVGCKIGSKEPTILNIYMFGELKNVDKVVKKFEDETKDTLNIKLNIRTNLSESHKKKLPMMISMGEKVDMVFDAYFMNLNKMVSDGQYADISGYFNNPDYPGLMKCFSPDYLESNAINGKTYGIPITQAPYDMKGLFIRKDLREKYGVGEIKDTTDLETFFKVIKEKEPALDAPLGVSSNNGIPVFDNIYSGKSKANIVSITDFEVALDDSGKKVESVTMVGDDEAEFKGRKAPFDKDTTAEWYEKDITKWMSDIQKDAIVEVDAYKNLFKTGKVAAVDGTVSQFAIKQAEMKQNIPNAELEFFPYIKDQYDMKEGAIVTGPQTAWNFMCIPENSTQKDAAMKFVDWIYQSQANHDLFEYGIEGEDWEAVGDDQYKLLNPEKPYVFNGYELTWNSNYVRVPSDLPDKVKKYIEYQSSDSTYVKSPIAGFVLDTSKITKEYTDIANIMKKYKGKLVTGSSGSDTKAIITQLHNEAEAAGAEKVKTEIKRQVEEFLSKKS